MPTHTCTPNLCIPIASPAPGYMFIPVYLQGLPVVLAPGEAEATAAALNAAGHVDAVATPDGDALVFGACTVYPTAKLLVRS